MYCSLFCSAGKTALSEEVFPHQPEVVLSVLHVQFLCQENLLVGMKCLCQEKPQAVSPRPGVLALAEISRVIGMMQCYIPKQKTGMNQDWTRVYLQ